MNSYISSLAAFFLVYIIIKVVILFLSVNFFVFFRSYRTDLTSILFFGACIFSLVSIVFVHFVCFFTFSVSRVRI